MARTKTPKPNLLVDEMLSQGVKIRSATDDARGSFVKYLVMCGRTEHGARLRIDPPLLDSAAKMERAYRQFKDFCGFRSRSLLKSTLNVAWMGWVLGQDPNISIEYITNTEEMANQRNAWLQSVLGTDDHKRCFPAGSVLKSGCRASKTTVKGKSDKAAPNVQVVGVDGARAGPHFDMLIMDDVCDTRNSLAQPARKELVKQMYHASIRPMINRRTLDIGRLGLGMTVYTGTSYAVDDLNADVDRIAHADADERTWVYDRLVCGGPPDFASPCPTIISSDDLRAIYESNNRAYEMNYMLLPMMDSERPFRQVHWYVDDWVFSQKQRDDFGENLPVMVPRNESHSSENPTWPRIMVVDPGFTSRSYSSCTGITIGTVGPDGTMYVFHAAKSREVWDTTVHELPGIYARYHCNRMLIEDAGTQSAVITHLRDLGVPYVEPIGAASRTKDTRARDVATAVNSGRVKLRGKLEYDKARNLWRVVPATQAMGVLGDDLLAWPGVIDKDLADAFIYLVQVASESSRPFVTHESRVTNAWEDRVALYREQAFGTSPGPETSDEFRVFMGQN